MRSPSRGLPSPNIKQDNINDSKVYGKNRKYILCRIKKVNKA
jgi:hypothetical protein